MRALLIGLVVSLVRPAVAQPASDPIAQAEAENAAGKAKIAVVDLAGAAAHFRAAIALSPDPRYYFNLCYTLEKAGQLREAKAACEVVASGGSDERLAGKARAKLAEIERGLRAGDEGKPEPLAPPGTAPVADPDDTLADGERVAPGTPITVSPRPPGGAIQADRFGRPLGRRPMVMRRMAAPVERRPPATWFIQLGFGDARVVVDDDEGSVADLDDTSSLLVGAVGAGVALWPASAFGFQLEGQLANRGFKVDGDLFDASATLTYLDLAALVRLEPGRGRFRVHAVAGGYLGFKVASSTSLDGDALDDQVASTDAGAILGAGFTIGRFRRAVNLDLRLQIGTKNVSEAPFQSVEHRVVLLMVGYVI